MASSAAPTAFPTDSIKPQTQSGTGLDSKLAPKPIYTLLEHFHSEDGKPSFHEYTGCGKLKSKTVLITGGDSGIGRAVALMMAREGAKISIVFLEQEMSDAKEVEHQIEKESQESNNGSSCLLIPLDLMSRDNCFKAVQSHVDKYGRVDVLVNNAGRQDLCDNFDQIVLDQVERTFRLNIFGMFAITKAVLPHMRRGGSIINSTSVAAYKSDLGGLRVNERGNCRFYQVSWPPVGAPRDPSERGCARDHIHSVTGCHWRTETRDRR